MLFAAQLTAAPAPVQQAFKNGETLDYHLSYLRLIGGTARMTVGPDADDASRLRITSVGQSNPWFRLFKVRDEIVTNVNRDTFTTLHFRKKLDERGRKKDEVTNVANGVAPRVTTSGKSKETKVPNPVYDPISLIYLFRTLDLSVGRQHEMQVLADGKLYKLNARVTGRETIATDAGTFRCVILEPTMYAVANDARDARLRIWYSEDERRLPVRIRFDVNFGTITATLKGIIAGVGSIDPPVPPQ